MIRTAATVTGVVIAASALLGCANTSDAGADPPTTPVAPSTHQPATTPPTTRATSPTPSDPTPTSPLPPQAREKSIAGAKAFVRVFVSWMNTAWQTQHTAQLRTLFADGCGSCESIAAGIDRIRRGGGGTEGADWTIRASTPIPIQTLAHPILHTAIRSTAGRWRPSKGVAWRTIPATTSQWDFHLAWTDDGWRMTKAVSQ